MQSNDVQTVTVGGKTLQFMSPAAQVNLLRSQYRELREEITIPTLPPEDENRVIFALSNWGRIFRDDYPEACEKSITSLSNGRKEAVYSAGQSIYDGDLSSIRATTRVREKIVEEQHNHRIIFVSVRPVCNIFPLKKKDIFLGLADCAGILNFLVEQKEKLLVVAAGDRFRLWGGENFSGIPFLEVNGTVRIGITRQNSSLSKGLAFTDLRGIGYALAKAS